uniref:Protocadherin mu6 n=1 Tax=Callorhinchus milii TaxID=7868 RepID=B0YN82_CALMI|nr:protocadherin mu6 [Callorhinchus milii]
MQTLSLLILLCVWDFSSGQIRYSIPEGLETGAFVGNIARDFGLDVRKLSDRRFRLISATEKRYFEVNLENGVLFVHEKIDREQLCDQSFPCLLNLEVVMENPLELYRAEVEIQDINDNSPSFSKGELHLEILESIPPGTRFPLQSAHDPDVGINSIRTYRLSSNEHFTLEVQKRSDGTPIAQMILEKYLDREKQRVHHLLLTAVDGGNPERSGSAQVVITVLDVNDNVPAFDNSVYRVSVAENVVENSLVIDLNATDLDEGSNADIIYSFSSHTPDRVRDLFSLEPETGEIRVKGVLDYEKASSYEINVEATNQGANSVPVYCKVLVDILDLNDFKPELTVMSLSSPVPEDAAIGTMIALLSVKDPDSGENGKTSCHLAPNLPFELKSSFENSYMLATKHTLDRETVPHYSINVTCRDGGSPALSTERALLVEISDINDNVPRFEKSSYTAYLMENNAPGSLICTVSARDPDLGQNAHISYSIQERHTQAVPVSSLVSINSDNGNIFSQRSFDYEQLKKIQVYVEAQDAGTPPLSSSTVVNVIVLDQNDNPPTLLSAPAMDASRVTVLRSAQPNSLVTKLAVTDADSGQNAKLFYQLLQAREQSLFRIIHSSGEVRTVRPFDDSDSNEQVLVILVKDNGHPSLSSTFTITLLLTDGVAEILSDFSNLPPDSEPSSNLALYIIICLGSFSFTLLVIIIGLVTTICHNDNGNHMCSLVICCFRRKVSKNVLRQSNVHLQIHPDSKLISNFVEVRGTGSLSQTYCYKVPSASEPASNDLVILTPFGSATRGDRSKHTEMHFSEWSEQATRRSIHVSREVGQLNTDWRSSEPYIASKISSQYLEENLAQDEIKREFNRRHTAITSAADAGYIEASPDLEDGIPTWAPRYGSQQLEHQEPDEYQPSIYMGGSPVRLPAKQDQVAKLDGQQSASSTKKKKKRSKRTEKRESKVTVEEPQNE